MSPDISGKVALVTGASSGIREAAARRLEAAGAKVVVVARRVEKLVALVEEIAQQGGKAIAICFWLASRSYRADHMPALAQQYANGSNASNPKEV